MGKTKALLFSLGVLTLCLFASASFAANPTDLDEPEINYGLLSENGSVTRDGDTLTISWKGMPDKGKATIQWRDLSSGTTGSVEAAVKNGAVTIADPNPGRRTLFILPSDGKSTVTLAERKVPALGMDNLRDLGGLKTADGHFTRWGMVYRGDTPFKLKREGYLYVANTMNLGYVFDLRGIGELSRKPVPAMDGVAYAHTQIPDLPPGYEDVSWDTTEDIFKFVSTPRALSFYVDTNAYMVDAPGAIAVMKRVFATALSGDGKAIIWHCAGGKDRTGYVSVVFLAALGVPVETITNEYMLTADYRKQFDLDEIEEMRVAFNNHPQAMAGFRAIQQSRPEYVMAGINRIMEKYGSMDSYLEKEIGLTQADIKKLRDLYLE